MNSKLKIRRLFLIIVLTEVIAIGSVSFFHLLTVKVQNELTQAENHRHYTITAISNLRHNLETQTRLASSYVVTKDTSFRKLYFGSNLMSLPNRVSKVYDNLYWKLIDDMSNIHAKGGTLLESFATISHHEPRLMELLNNSRKNSLIVANLEHEAFITLKQDLSDLTARPAGIGQSLAVQLLFSRTYVQAKEKVMSSLDEYLSIALGNDSEMVHSLKVKLEDVNTTLNVLVILFVLLNLMILLVLDRRIIKVIGHITSTIKNHQEGELQFNHIYSDEFKTMIEAYSELDFRLRTNQIKYKTLFRKSAFGIMILDINLRVTEANEALQSLIGYRSEELVSFAPLHFIIADDRSTFIHTLSDLQDKNTLDATQIEIRLLTKEQLEVYAEIKIVPLKLEDNKTVFYILVNDITERVRAEKIILAHNEQLNSYVERLNQAQKTGSIGDWSWDMKTGYYDWSNNLYEMLGLKSTSSTPTYHEQLQLLTEKSAQKLDMILRQIKVDGVSRELEIQTKPKINVPTHLLARCVAIYDDQDNIVGLSGTLLDVSKQKRLEEKLLHEKEIRELYLNTTQTIMLALDKNGRVTMSNKAAKTLFGERENSIVGKLWFDELIQSSCTKSEQYNDLKGFPENIENILPYYETEVQCQDLPKRLIAWKNVHLRNEEGKIDGVLVSGEDVTERRKNERFLKLLSELTAEFSLSSNINTGFAKVANSLCDFTGWRDCFVWFRREGDFTFERCCATARTTGDERHTLDIFFPKHLDEHHWLGAVIATKKSIFKLDISQSQLSDQGIPVQSVLSGSSFAFAIKVGNRTEAIMAFYSDTRTEPDRMMMSWLEEVGYRLGSILEQKIVLQQLLQNQERLKEAQFISKMGSWEWSSKDQTMFWSDEVYRIFQGLSPVNISDISNMFGSAIHPDDQHRVGQRRENHLNDQEPYTLRYRIYCNDELKYIEEQVQSSFDQQGNILESRGTVQDITTQVIFDIKLKESKERLNMATEAGNIGIWDWNIEMNELIWEDSMHQLYETDPHNFEVSFESWMNILHSGDVHRAKKSFSNTLNHGESLNTQFRIMTPTGKVKFIQTKAGVHFNEAGKPQRMLGVNLDVTEIERAKIKVQESADKLKTSNTELENFAYIASHDLQEPVRVITGLIKILDKKYSDTINPRGLELMDRISSAAGRMTQLIRDLLEYSRVERKELAKELINLETLLNVVLDDLQIIISRSKAKIEISTPLPQLIGDPVQIRSVFQNLISNAIKYKKDNINPVITISANVSKKNIEIRVVDNGIGIAQKHYERIFKIFQRLHTREQYEGTGIGLAITKKIVERHNGKISLESIENQGTTFIIKLPSIEKDLSRYSLQTKGHTIEAT